MPILFDRQKGTYKAARSVEHWVSWSVHMGREIWRPALFFGRARIQLLLFCDHLIQGICRFLTFRLHFDIPCATWCELFAFRNMHAIRISDYIYRIEDVDIVELCHKAGNQIASAWTPSIFAFSYSQFRTGLYVCVLASPVQSHHVFPRATALNTTGFGDRCPSYEEVSIHLIPSFNSKTRILPI